VGLYTVAILSQPAGKWLLVEEEVCGIVNRTMRCRIGFCKSRSLDRYAEKLRNIMYMK